MSLAHHRIRPFVVSLVPALALAAQGCAGAQPDPPWQDGRSAGIEARADVRAADLGMPLYPGASARKDKPDENDSVSLAIWGGSKGLKVGAAKYVSADPPERVAAFYRLALGRFGAVLDCGSAVTAAGTRPGDGSADDKALRCTDTDVARRTLKVGTPGRERSVTVAPSTRGTLIDLARVQIGD